MAFNEGSFLEGAIAGGIAGAGAGAVAAPVTGGVSFLILGAAGAVLGALLKLKFIQALLFIAIIYLFGKSHIFPPYVIIVLIILFFVMFIGGGKKRR